MAHLPPAGELPRAALLQRLERARPRIAAFIAPAGFGKSTLARQLLAGRAGAVCDVTEVGSELDLALALLPALAQESPERTHVLTQRELLLGDAGRSAQERIALALDAWRIAPPDSVIVFEHAESIADNAAARAFFERLLEECPPARTVVICSRRPLNVHLTRFAAPHEIVSLRAADLAFDDGELQQLFADLGSEELQKRAVEVSQGWPIAVFLLRRFAAEGRIERLLRSLNDVAFDELHDYLADQVVASFSPLLIEGLFVCACIPDARLEDVQAALEGDDAVRTLAEFAKGSAFLTRDSEGVFRVHPLLVPLLVGSREGRDGMLSRAAQAHAAAKRFVRAAELHLARGDHAAAAQALGRHEVVRDHTPSMAYARVLGSIDAALVARYPRLWAIRALLRAFCVDTADLLDEAEAVWRTLPRETHAAERSYVLLFRVLLMSHMGLLDEAETLVREFARELQAESEPRNVLEGYVFFLFGIVRARRGEIAAAERDLTMALPLVGGVDAMASSTLLCLGADVARVRGDFPIARQYIDRAIAGSRRSGLTNMLAMDLAEAAFGAWLFGDEAGYERYGAELDMVVGANGVHGLSYFTGIVRGRAAEPQDADLLKWVACGRMVAAADPAQRANSVLHARAAIAAAEQSGMPFIYTLALVTLAICDDGEREDRLAQAAQTARHCGSLALVAAVDALAAGEPARGMLDVFIARLQQQRAEAEPALHVDLLSGRVRAGEREIALPDREWALLAALALRRESVARSRLADLLWPDLDEYAARNALSVCLHRLRNRLGNELAIERTRDGHALSASVSVDLWEIERALASVRGRSALRMRDVALLERAYERLCARPPQRLRGWEWFEPTLRRAEELRVEAAQRLSAQALQNGEIARALELAGDVIALDACDESAARIAIRAHLAAGDRPAAMREYRRYREVLLDELGCEPAEEIDRLLGLERRVKTAAH